jgi:YHS domain-containing protein
MKHYLTFLLTFLCLGVMAQQENGERRRNFNTEHFIGLREFDPVSYFQNKPVKGNSKIEYEYKGITYYFSSEANREEFKKAPGKYEPAYGGWCAYTVALNGERVKVDPTTYKIINGKLFLFYNFNGDNRLRKWNANKDEKSLKASADKNWVKKMH